AVLLIAAGLVIDWLIWLIRWQPYHIWAQRMRRFLRIAPPEEDETELDAEEAARAAYAAFEDAYMPPEHAGDDEEGERFEQWMPLESPVVDEEAAQQVMDAADQVPDEALGQYPGMRYDSCAAAQDMLSGTRRFGAVHQEGPGAAEVKSRRAEIDAWQRQMQEEARAKAEAERRAREEEVRRAREEREAREAQAAYEAEQARLAKEAYEAEQARLAKEAYEAEQARLAKEAYEAEQARLAQEAYEQELREYELKRAQYERDMAEYERQMAEYEAALAAQQAQEEARVKADVKTEFAQENPQAAASPRRRRRAVTYSDMVEAEAAYDLPEAPQWTQMQAAPVSAPQPQPDEEEAKHAKRSILRSGMAKMAQMMEPESEEIAGIAALPPRVDRNAAYRPPKKPDGKKA
ncbi:MAG: hypothetical protein IJ337_07965, partial [Clostridia bacterium]|nr:hypothetical protein [Clostridia bacterium]